MPRGKEPIPEKARKVMEALVKALDGRIVYLPSLKGRNWHPVWLLRDADGRWKQASTETVEMVLHEWMCDQLDNPLLDNDTARQIRTPGMRVLLVMALTHSPRIAVQIG